MERLQGSKNEIHGNLGDIKWLAPRIVAKCEEANRPKHGNYIPASEYMDEDEVLEQKVELLASLIKQAKCCTAYTGAGLSRAAGIGDYASKAANSVTNSTPRIKISTCAQPTYSHRALATLHNNGLLHRYVQQNHDGLPQKAGFPQHQINEIHGAWFDPSNPVVKFNENLRSDLFEWLEEIIEETDLCLCLGTSLSGMNADRTASKPAKRSLASKPRAIGTVIINLQRTRLDSKSCLRIWAKLDDVFEMLMKKLDILVTPLDIEVPQTSEKFVIPYNKDGLYDSSCKMIWNLNIGQRIVITNPYAKNYMDTGVIEKKNSEGNYHIHVGKRRILLGRWWVQSLIEGKWDYHIPFVNESPEFVE